jgi:hypothetical protein
MPHLRLNVAFQWFLTLFSLRPGMRRAMSDHLLPSSRWACRRAGTYSPKQGMDHMGCRVDLAQSIVLIVGDM